MMKYEKLFMAVLILCLSFACDDDDSIEPTPDPVNVYENCCGVAPVEMDFNPGKVFMPNIFTPKALDGVNDHFYVQTDDDIVTVEIFRVSDADGNVVFEILDVLPNNPVYAWIPEDDVTNGYYEYFVKLKNINGDEFDVTGGVCIFECDDDNPFEYTENCGSPAQNTGQGGFDPTLPDNEPACM